MVAFSYAEAKNPPHAHPRVRYVRASDPSLYRWTGGGGSPFVCFHAVVHHRATGDRGQRAADPLCTRRGPRLTTPLDALAK
jgi:hypothetical protein